MVCDHFLDHGLAMPVPDLILDPPSKLVTHVALFGCTVATRHFQREARDANDERLSSVLCSSC